jgi:uncharacterized protein YceK
MRSITLTLLTFALLFLSGCGCIEKWTDPRVDDRPLSDDGGKTYWPRDPAQWPDPAQPAWQQWLFGTRFVSSQRP